jgi:hypothetical protein
MIEAIFCGFKWIAKWHPAEMDFVVLRIKVLTVTFGVYVKSNDQYSVLYVW